MTTPAQDYTNLHYTWSHTDKDFETSPIAKLHVFADQRDLDGFVYAAELTFQFGDSVAEFSVQFCDQGLESLGTQMLEAAGSIRKHRIENKGDAE